MFSFFKGHKIEKLGESLFLAIVSRFLQIGPSSVKHFFRIWPQDR